MNNCLLCGARESVKGGLLRKEEFSNHGHDVDYHWECAERDACRERAGIKVCHPLAPPSNSPITPAHYVSGTYEPRKVIQAWGLGWATGNAVAYIARAGKKPGNSAADDISKAANDLLMELDHMGVDVRVLCEEMVGRIEEGKK